MTTLFSQSGVSVSISRRLVEEETMGRHNTPLAVPLNMVNSVMVHAVLQTEPTLGAARDANTGPAASKPLSLTLYNVLNSVLMRSVL